jgi:hypothetical protein
MGSKKDQKPRKKLNVRKTTIRRIEEGKLGEVAGGGSPTGVTCCCTVPTHSGGCSPD